MFRAENAFPEDVRYMKRDRAAQSSFDLCKVFETSVEMAVYDKGSALIQVGRDLPENMDLTFSTISLQHVS